MENLQLYLSRFVNTRPFIKKIDLTLSQLPSAEAQRLLDDYNYFFDSVFTSLLPPSALYDHKRDQRGRFDVSVDGIHIGKQTPKAGFSKLYIEADDSYLWLTRFQMPTGIYGAGVAYIFNDVMDYESYSYTSMLPSILEPELREEFGTECSEVPVSKIETIFNCIALEIITKTSSELF